MATTKLEARTKYFPGKKRYATPTGDGWEDEYGYDLNERGQKILIKTGKKNLYEEIQAHAEEVKIENILKRVAVGDMSDFRTNGIYADVTKVPNNLIDARKEMVKLENTWSKLPADIRAKYDNSVETFIAEAGKESWLIDMGLVDPKIAEKTPTIKDTVPETTPEIPDVS